MFSRFNQGGLIHMIKSNIPLPPAIAHKHIAAVVRFLVLAAFLVTVTQTSSALADKRDFTIVNHADKSIHYVYCTAYSNRNWQKDVLGNDTIMPGESKKLYFNSVTVPDRYWDVRIVFAGGADWYWRKIDLYKVGRMTIYKSGSKYYASWN